ncbi:zinc finger protein 771-like [Frankliniella occidentalis]|uniref:Zinc finger protein 771-like n=1 Tax=Frankliniella occidentalis TaxID=133901 RepID=A0A9C6XA38_FRAOC|nr:zinc finger protein 771-like [Frankliniella occidentalis]
MSVAVWSLNAELGTGSVRKSFDWEENPEIKAETLAVDHGDDPNARVNSEQLRLVVTGCYSLRGRREHDPEDIADSKSLEGNEGDSQQLADADSGTPPVRESFDWEENPEIKAETGAVDHGDDPNAGVKDEQLRLVVTGCYSLRGRREQDPEDIADSRTLEGDAGDSQQSAGSELASNGDPSDSRKNEAPAVEAKQNGAERSVHTVEKPYQCDICKHCFPVKRTLVAHIRTHTGERSYECDFCKQRFAIKKTLVDHIRTHTGERPYQCDICEQGFAVKCNLVAHMRTHTGERPYNCDFCKQRFVEKGALNKHIRTHTGERPFQCDICNHSFSAKRTLERHIRTHTGERPYQCDICKQQFKQKSHLVRHLKTHSLEKA